MNYKLLILLFSVCIIHSPLYALTVEEAYAAVPHKRTLYMTGQSRLSAANSDYLQQLFTLTDEALILRIRFMRGERDEYLYEDVLAQLKQLQAPAIAQAAHKLIIRAITQQFHYFKAPDLNNSKQKRKLMQSSHRLLIAAYNELMKKLPDSKHNKKAYFDHLCALDFI